MTIEPPSQAQSGHQLDRSDDVLDICDHVAAVQGFLMRSDGDLTDRERDGLVAILGAQMERLEAIADELHPTLQPAAA